MSEAATIPDHLWDSGTCRERWSSLEWWCWCWPWLARLGLGRLPGDIVIEHEDFCYIPIITSIIVGAVLTPGIWLLQK